MRKIELTVPEYVKYLSDWKELWDLLPQNEHIILDKQICGCGATEMFINSGKKVDWKQELSTADKLIGDVDLDGEVSIMDATEIQLHLASLVEFTDEQLKLADIDFFTGVNILDVTSIQLKLAGYKVY